MLIESSRTTRASWYLFARGSPALTFCLLHPLLSWYWGDAFYQTILNKELVFDGVYNLGTSAGS